MSSLLLSVAAMTASAASAGSGVHARANCGPVKYAHVIVLTRGHVRLAGKRATVTGRYGAAHRGGRGYGGYYLPAGASHTLPFGSRPRVCLTTRATSAALSAASLRALRRAVNAGPYNFYGIVLRKGRITRIDQVPALAMSGEWEGRYTCNQGLTGLDLRVKASANGKLTAFFDFYPVVANPGVPSGSFTMSGHYNAKGVRLTPGKWLLAPSGYVTVGLSGRTPGAKGVNTFRGAVHGPGCTGFVPHRLAGAPDAAAVAGKWKGTYVCAQGNDGTDADDQDGQDRPRHDAHAAGDVRLLRGACQPRRAQRQILDDRLLLSRRYRP